MNADQRRARPTGALGCTLSPRRSMREAEPADAIAEPARLVGIDFEARGERCSRQQRSPSALIDRTTNWT
ncbi:MAG: hypothetical protein R3E65_06520 [Steroidobacteraceae bacterium]